MPLVSVITRTKDRPLMMARAAESVRRQTMADWEWVIVNDGGPRVAVDELADASRRAGLAVRVFHNETSLGMEGASNCGIQGSDSEFVVIHDDDDTWHESFLAKTTQYLQALPVDSVIKGVVSRTTKIIERIEADRIVELRRTSYDDSLSAISLFQMARLNRVHPPISFLYRRSVFDRIGLYRDDLSVLGDWEFNLRFLSHFEIGVIPERLANYHLRTKLMSGIYGNTVVAGVDKHLATAARLRNEMLRTDLNTGRFGLGVIVNLCHELESVRGQMSILERILARLTPKGLRMRIAEFLDS